MDKINYQLIDGDDDMPDNYAKLKIAHQRILELSDMMWNWPSATTLTSSSIGRILHLNNIYQQIHETPGAICEFGIHFGASTNVIKQLIHLYEPASAHRDHFVFDTFQGFVGTRIQDGAKVQDGDFLLEEKYELFLAEILSIHDTILKSPTKRRRTKIYKGDASETVDTFLDENPEVSVALLILDMDIYLPTKNVLRALIPRLTKGSVVVFDEYNHPSYPGESIALREELGSINVRLRKSKFSPYSAWFVWE